MEYNKLFKSVVSPKNSHLNYLTGVKIEELDSLGFRNLHKYESSKVVALGCSNTFGIGHLYKNTWPYKLGEFLNTPVNNLGIPGGSIMGLYRVFKGYLDSGLKAEKVFIWAPPHTRSEYFYEEDGKTFIKILTPNTPPNKTEDLDLDSFLKLKTRFEITNESYIEYSYELNVNAIDSLCLRNNIDLYFLEDPRYKFNRGKYNYKNYYSESKEARAFTKLKEKWSLALDNQHLGVEYQDYIFNKFKSILKNEI